MPEKLPTGWAKTTLGEITEPSPKRALPMEFPSMPYVGLEHIEPHSMRLLGHGNAFDVRSSSIRFSKGEVLYGKMRPYLNKVWVAEFDGLCSAEFLVFPKREGLNGQFLAMRLNAEDFVTFANRQASGERPRVDFKKLSLFPILLPPATEQVAIVDKLNATLSGMERAKTAARRAQERLKRYRAAVLDAAITGELTRAWRETQRKNNTLPGESGEILLQRLLSARRAGWEETELKRFRTAGKEPKNESWKGRYSEPEKPEIAGLPESPSGWTWASAEQLTEATRPITYGVIKLGAEVEGGVPVLRSSDVRHLLLETARVKRIAKRIADEYQRTYLKGGEVLVTVRGTLGGVAAVPARCAGYNISREVAMLALLEPKTSRVVAYFIGAHLLQQWLNMRTRGIAYTGINIEALRFLPIPVPPLIEQAEIVREVERRLSASERLATTLEQQLATASTTRQSILHEAFAGRLVSQDSMNIPASILLDHIRAERAGEAQKQKVKRMPKSKPEMKTGGRRNLLVVLKESGRPMTPEELFHASGHSQESVDQFFAELRELTTTPKKIAEERRAADVTLLRALP